MRNYSPRCRGGFSLVEVVLALGVATFCLLTLMGLLAVGTNGNKMTIQQSVAVDIAGGVISDLRATPLATQSYSPTRQLYSPRFSFQLPAISTPTTGMQTVYLSADGTPLTGVNPTSLAGLTSPIAYRVTILIPPRATGTPQRLASSVYILVTWPGLADPTPTTWPKNYVGSFQSVTYLDQN